jgi:hypothetical protein
MNEAEWLAAPRDEVSPAKSARSTGKRSFLREHSSKSSAPWSRMPALIGGKVICRLRVLFCEFGKSDRHSRSRRLTGTRGAILDTIIPAKDGAGPMPTSSELKL